MEEVEHDTEDIMRYKIVTKFGTTKNGHGSVSELRRLKDNHLIYIELDDEILSFLEQRKEECK